MHFGTFPESNALTAIILPHIFLSSCQGCEGARARNLRLCRNQVLCSREGGHSRVHAPLRSVMHVRAGTASQVWLHRTLTKLT